MSAHIKDSITITPIGNDTNEVFNAMLEGKSRLYSEVNPCVSTFSKNSKWYGYNASQIAEELIIKIAGKNSISLQDETLSIIISTTKGDIEQLKSGNYLLSSLSDTLKERLNLANMPIILSNACISGVSSVIVAKRLIESGKFKNIIVVGVDTFTQFVYSGFDSFKSLSSNPCKPYDAERDGLNLGEAGAALLISDNGNIIIKGGAISNDANHISGPSRTGDGLYFAIKEAMEEAYGTLSQPLSFINTHGTATLYNDEMESKAIALADLATTPLNTLKGYIGHTLGASGVVEIALCIKQLEEGLLLGTKGFSKSGVPHQLNISSENRPLEEPLNCLKTASGFGGCNAAVVLELSRPEQMCEDKKDLKTTENQPYNSTPHKRVKIECGKIWADGEILFESEPDFHNMIRLAYKEFCRANMKFYKMDDLCKLGYVAAEIILKDEDLSNQNATAIILCNDNSSLDTDIKHQEIIDSNLPASPAVFVYTLPNLVLGEICIRHKIKGENTFFISAPQSNCIDEYANLVLQRDGVERVIYGWCSYFNGSYKAEFNLIKK